MNVSWCTGLAALLPRSNELKVCTKVNREKHYGMSFAISEIMAKVSDLGLAGLE